MAFPAQLVSIPCGYFNMDLLQLRGAVHCPVGQSANNALVVTITIPLLDYMDTAGNIPTTFV